MSGLIFSSQLLLSGCGQKGPLYMPEKKVATPSSTTIPADAPTTSTSTSENVKK
ncbi:LPS translocon maturation chaperone LptM [Undibacterium danionis]|uniref:Lipoprotein n=1 Tax=Undibacterium danionis TaxID=1812100 RepID=A0ABV6IAX1_9BURK